MSESVKSSSLTSSIPIPSSTSTSTSTTTSTSTPNLTFTNTNKIYDTLNSLLQKYCGELTDNQINKYHHEQFIDQMDNIVQQWMVKLIIELKQFEQTHLSPDKESTMMAKVRTDLEYHFPPVVVSSTDNNNGNQQQNISKMYRDFAANLNHQNPNLLPCYHSEALYLPTGVMSENETILSIYSILSPMIVDILDKLWRLSSAIELLAPTVEFAHNTGQLVQDRVIQQIEHVRNQVIDFEVNNGWLTYATGHMKRLEAIFMLPQSEDGRLAYLEFERTHFRFIQTTVRDLVFEFILLNHLMMQHMNYLKQPRTDHTQKLAAKIVN